MISVFFVCVLLVASVLALGPDCSNTDSLMTPALREQVLHYINEGRNKLKNGELTLSNGEHPLIPLNMPELSWSCEDEEEMYQMTKDICRSGIYPTENYTWSLSQNNQPHASVVNSGLIYVDLFGYSHNYLSRHTIFTWPSPLNAISAIHDKAETVACALYDCIKDEESGGNGDIELPGLPTSTTTNYFFCKITPDVQFGEKIYEASPADMTNFPFQDVICPLQYGMDIELRELILQRINTVRQQIQQSTYVLQNGSPALQAVNMPNLIWDCDEESAVLATVPFTGGCPATTEPDTVFQTIGPLDYNTPFNTQIQNAVSAFFDQLFDQNSNLNFLSQSTTYSTPYPAAFTLSDQATHIACATSFCYDEITQTPNFNFVCRVKPSTLIGDQLYQV